MTTAPDAADAPDAVSPTCVAGSPDGCTLRGWRRSRQGPSTAQQGTDSLAQSIVIPAATSATGSFWLKVTSSETTTTTAYDTLKVQIVSGTTTTTLATYSNLNKGTVYVQKSLNLSAYVGKTVTLQVVGAEDSSLATSFFVDDFSVTTA